MFFIRLRDQQKDINAIYRYCDYQTCSLKNENLPLADHCSPTVSFWLQSPQKLFIFQDGGDGLFDPTASFHSGHPGSGQMIIGFLGGSVPPRSGLWMQIKVSFLSGALWRKPISNAAAWHCRTVGLNAAK